MTLRCSLRSVSSSVDQIRHPADEVPAKMGNKWEPLKTS